MAITLKLKPKKDNLDFIDIATKISNGQDINLSDYEVYSSYNSLFDNLDEIQNYLLKNGMSSLMVLEPIFEHIVPKGEKKEVIIGVLQRYLDNVNIDNELIIIDPYFFATTHDTTYSQTISDVLEKYLTTLDSLLIITNDKVNNSLKLAIESKLRSIKPKLVIQHKESQNYHDRFWISNKRSNGIVTGTSLNGLGRKFALIDHLNIIDVQVIVNSLNTEGLL